MIFFFEFVKKIWHLINLRGKSTPGLSLIVEILAVRMQQMVCTLTVELKVSVQSTLMAITQLNGEWTWEVWPESVTSISSTGLKTKVCCSSQNDRILRVNVLLYGRFLAVHTFCGFGFTALGSERFLLQPDQIIISKDKEIFFVELY